MSRFIIASGRRVHHDALDWARRVRTNGGSVSQRTLRAVSQFCDAIDRAGIRNRFYRLNLFCGNSDGSLLAVRTPLYRGPSLTGTQYGNTLDTNVSFVAADYSESAGLTGNGATKYLQTGCSVSGMGLSVNWHHSQAFFGSVTFGNRMAFGSISSGTNSCTTYIQTLSTWNMTYGNSVSPTGTLPGRTLISRTSSSLASGYFNGAAAGTNTTAVTITPTADELWVFRNSQVGTAGQGVGIGMRHYSFGDSMTATQAAAFDAALAAFFTAMGRV